MTAQTKLNDATTRTPALDWLIACAVIAVFCLVFQGGIAARVEHLGSDAFPNWMWRLYDHKVGPLTLPSRGFWIGPRP